ncbi:hypothetical protein CJ430_31880, partial [Klebsiella pneumoniae]
GKWCSELLGAAAGGGRPGGVRGMVWTVAEKENESRREVVQRAAGRGGRWWATRWSSRDGVDGS